MKKNLLIIACILFLFSACKTKMQHHPNVIFISVDDLRAELGCYGNTLVQSPNLDQLAEEGTLFTNHFVSVPTCGASRQCLLTGIRPVSKEYCGNDITAKVISEQQENEKPETFIHQLKRNGYYTVGIGKISHSVDGFLYGYEDQPTQKRELPYSWNEVVFNYGKWGTGWNAFFGYANGENRQSMNRQVKPYECGDVNDKGYVDGLTAQLAISKLKELRKGSKPFFLGVGFFKPHLPFNAPKKYWNLYNRDSIPISPNPFVPENVKKSSLSKSGEFNGYLLGEEKATLDKPVSEAYAKKIRHAYYACISYVDAQIGLLINEIHKLGLDENTIIVVWGDHGWHLGDQQVWGKHTLFENSLKSTLIIKVPGKYNTKSISSIIETVDIYPTLLELCNVKQQPHTIDGESFAGLFDGKKSNYTELAYSYYHGGISMRTDRYRITCYYQKPKSVIELYDHMKDPYETINIAEDNPKIVEQLIPLLEKGNNGIYN